MFRVAIVLVLVLLGWVYLPDVLTTKNRLITQSGVNAVAKTGVQGVAVVAKAVANNYVEPVIPPDPVEVQTKAIVKVTETLTKMPEAIAEGVAKASAKQLEDVNRRLAQQDAANAKTAEVAQATISTIGKVVDRIDKLDTAIKELKDERTKVPSSPKEEAKPAADTEEPEAKEGASFRSQGNGSVAPVKRVGANRNVSRVSLEEEARRMPVPPPPTELPRIVRQDPSIMKLPWWER